MRGKAAGAGSEESLVHRIAFELDKPSVYMGGPSRSSMRKAQAIVEIVAVREADQAPEGERADAIPTEAVKAAHDLLYRQFAGPGTMETTRRALLAALPFLRAAQPEAGSEEAERVTLAEALRWLRNEDPSALKGYWPALHALEDHFGVVPAPAFSAAHPEADRASEENVDDLNATAWESFGPPAVERDERPLSRAPERCPLHGDNIGPRHDETCPCAEADRAPEDKR